MDLSLQNKKIELIHWLSTLNDQSLIDKLMKLREKEKTDRKRNTRCRKWQTDFSLKR